MNDVPLRAFEGVRPIFKGIYFAYPATPVGSWPVTPMQEAGLGQISPLGPIPAEIVSMQLQSESPAPPSFQPPGRGRGRGRGRGAAPRTREVEPIPAPEEGSSESPQLYDDSGMISTELVSMQMEGRFRPPHIGQPATTPVFQWPGHTAMVLGPSSWGFGIGAWGGTAHAVAPGRHPSQSLWY